MNRFLPHLGCLCAAAVISLAPSRVHAATLTVNPASTATLTRAQKVGLNVEMSLLSDQMRLANGGWVDETFVGTGFNALRWGYGAWEWDWASEAPLTFDFWAAYNVGDDNGSFGLKEFLAFCRTANTVPLLMIPVEVEKYPEHSWSDIKNMAGAMASYIQQKSLSTPVYFELGNEPAFTLAQSTYQTRLTEMSPVIKAVNPAFKFGASVDGPGTPYNPNTLITSVGSSIDFIDFHRYTSIGTWAGYFAKNDDTFFSHNAVSEEAFLGECNILWPDWNGRMPNDLQGSLPLLNGLLSRIEANAEQYITTWPSHWPSHNGNEPYGMFNYDAWFHAHQTVLFTGPIYVHRMINDNVLPLRLTGETSSDAKVRIFAYTNAAQSRLNLFVINKKSTAEPLTINTTQTFGYVQAFVLSAPALDSETPTYQPHVPAMTAVGSPIYINTVPKECAVLYSFYNDAATVSPGSFALNAPAASATGVSSFKTFTWGAAAGAQSYKLTIAGNSSFSNPVFDREVGLVTRYQVIEPLLNTSTTYYWKVVAINKAGQTNATGNGRSFATAPPSTTPYWSGQVVNGSFEDGLQAWANWGNARRTVIAGEVIAGNYSGKIETGSGGLGQDVFGLVPGTTCQLHVSTRATSPMDQVTLGISFYNSAGTELAAASWLLAQVTTIANTVNTFTVPANTARSQVWLWKDGGNGDLFVDAVATRDISRDNTDATGIAIAGAWTESMAASGYVGSNYLHDGNASKGSRSVTYSPTLSSSGAYDVFIAYTSGSNRANNVPVTITHAGGIANVSLNQQIGGGWTRIGSWTFNAGSAGSIRIYNTGTSGYVVADAVRFVPLTLQNSGFEDGNTYWADWGNAVVVASNGRSGVKSIKVGPAAGGRGQTISTGAGVTYALGGWGKVSAATETGWIGISAYNSSNVKIGEAAFELHDLSYTGDSTLLTTPVGTSYVIAWVWKDAGTGGVFYADDIRLTRQ